MRLSYLLLCLIIAPFSTSTSVAKDLMDPIIVTATKIKTQDTKATYASEVYNRKDIERSGATSVYEFLNQNTSVAIAPNYGDLSSQLIDIRGFGLVEGFKNVAVTVNGRRMNNIDSVPQKLMDIGINNIDRIEITKGSGSVIHGDGAVGGSIQIYTRDTTDTTVTSSAGNHGIVTGSFTTGLSEGKFALSVSGNHYNQDGFSDPGPNGIKDRASFQNYTGKLKYFPTDASELFIETDHATSNFRYPSALTEENFEQHPDTNRKTTNGPTNYTFQTSNTNNVNLGGSIELTPNLELSIDYAHQYKVIVNLTHKQYYTNAVNSSLNYRKGSFNIISGVQTWDAKRRNTEGWAGKDNTGVFFQTNYDTGKIKFSAGARREWVDYQFNDNSDNDKFIAYDLGINRSINDHLSIFSNFNSSFMAPDVDRWFKWPDSFNGFIEPTTSNTINVGLNHVTSKNKLKATVYGMKLQKEQLFNPINWNNTNIDKSHKYGIEIQNKHIFYDQIFATINYTFTRAIIDRIEDAEATNMSCGTFECNGNTIPGVSEHNITIGITFTPTLQDRFQLTQNYRSEAYVLEDIANNESQKNIPFTTTDISYNYKYKPNSKNALFSWWKNGPRQAELIFKVDNLFNQINGLYNDTDEIYPTNFTRNISLGTKLNF